MEENKESQAYRNESGKNVHDIHNSDLSEADMVRGHTLRSSLLGMYVDGNVSARARWSWAFRRGGVLTFVGREEAAMKLGEVGHVFQENSLDSFVHVVREPKFLFDARAAR